MFGADIDFGPGWLHCLPACVDLIAAERRYLKYLCSDGPPPIRRLWRESQMLIHLCRFQPTRPACDATR